MFRGQDNDAAPELAENDGSAIMAVVDVVVAAPPAAAARAVSRRAPSAELRAHASGSISNSKWAWWSGKGIAMRGDDHRETGPRK